MAIIFNKRIFNDLDDNKEKNVVTEGMDASMDENVETFQENVETFQETSLQNEQASVVDNNSNKQ
jgi:hypothetical protein